MIRVRVFTDEEWVNASVCGNKECKYRAYEALRYFEGLLNNTFIKNPCAPFRDAESLLFLRETYDITFVSDDDWYSVMYEGSRSDIISLDKRIRFGLAAIDLSKEGKYVWHMSAEEQIWKILARMPFDILIAIKISEMGLYGDYIRGVDYLIENYPYKDQTIEVTVKESLIDRDDFYTPELGYRERHGYGYGLHRGRDGQYYCDKIDIDYAFQYYWKNDIEGIIHKIDSLRKDRIALTDTVRIYDIFELGALLEQDRPNCIMGLDYQSGLEWLEWQRKEKGMSEEEYNERLETARKENNYEEYLYFKDKFKVICHLAFAPEETAFRKLPMLMVDKKKDGTYLIHGDLTVKYPEFHELLEDVIRERSAEWERFVLVVAGEELLYSVNDIEHAVCGFRVLEDSVDVYDAYEGTQLFGEALKEAYYSGRCTVDNGFY